MTERVPEPENASDVDATLEALEEWFTDRPEWLQDAARRIFDNGSLGPSDMDELLVLCKREAGFSVAGHEALVAQPVKASAFVSAPAGSPLRMDQISDVTGINALAPRKPLSFGTEPLTIVYGGNGSGKSGYIRLLKHACGARAAFPPRDDVFRAGPQPQSCTVTYTLDGTSTPYPWTPAAGACADLQSVCLYDSDSARALVFDENEVAYEPPILMGFSLLVEACDELARRLDSEIAAAPAKLPAIPSDAAETVCGKWFTSLVPETTDADIATHCAWNETLAAELVRLRQRLSEEQPEERAKLLRGRQKRVHDLATLLKSSEARLSDDAFLGLRSSRDDAGAKRQASDEDAAKVFAGAPLGGIGTDSWRLLWEQARSFSEAHAYHDHAFPNIADAAVCVLCQQPLSDAAKTRFADFESFVKGELQSAAEAAEALLQDILDDFHPPPTTDDIETAMELGGVADEATKEAVRSHCELLRTRHSSFASSVALSELAPMPNRDALDALAGLDQTLDASAAAFEVDAKADEKPELRRRVGDLEAQKWLSEQKAAIDGEVKRLKLVQHFQGAQRLAHTKVLSDKKTALAELLVTPAFTARFQEELDTLRSLTTPVTITHTRTTKGRVWHRIAFPDSVKEVKLSEVLSEGEFRIVSIAAFLADMNPASGNAPLILDDPISSLDQDFEESVAGRLSALAKTRQVIVFTHRLSLIASLEAAAKERGIKVGVVSLRREPWGTGEPGEPPLPAIKPKAALQKLINDRLPLLRKVLTTEGNAAYEVQAKGLCSEIRITVERLIENDLLADVVQRFRRPITTKGKLKSVAKVTATDCALLDGMMTKYSLYEHSQPNEAPVALPQPNELEQYLKRLRDWRDEFEGRQIPTVNE